ERMARSDKRPFFGFLLLDAPHQTYAWPPETTPFQPSVTILDYLELSSRPSTETIRTIENSYRNAVRFADESAEAILRWAYAEGGANTVAIVTGDHGEEFWEN